MKLFNTLIALLMLFSCDREESVTKEKGQYIGYWTISQNIFFEPSEYPGPEYRHLPLYIDTTNRIIGENGILKPTHQNHEVFINSNYLSFDSNSIFEFSVDKLLDGQYTYIYKSELVDFSSIKKITVSIHGEQLSPDNYVNDKDVTVLLRLCSDTSIRNNYYELERPIILTKNKSNVLSEMWPNENFINIELDKLIKFKDERDSLWAKNNFPRHVIYYKTENGEKHSICNNPDITKFSRICIGIKNPDYQNPFNNNDGLSKSIKILIY